MSHASRAGRVADTSPRRATIGASPRSAGRGGRPRCAARLGFALAAGILLAGCGPVAPAATEVPVAPTSVLPSTEAPVPPLPTSSAALSTPAPSPKTRTAPPAAGAATPERVTLPWPAATTAEVRALQASVDNGSEPWLLDPTEVAMSYVSAAHGWTQAQAQARPGGKSVDVQEGRQKLLLSLDQPSRAGAGGIWVVTAETPSG